MSEGLNVSRLVNVSVNFSPLDAQFANFNSLLIVGDSDVIDVGERIRSYDAIDEVAADFGTTAPEFLAAELFFSQAPQPTQLYIGRWAQAATKGLLKGGILTAAQQLMSNWTVITNGGVVIKIDGVTKTLTGLDFSGASNLNGVAAIIDSALSGGTVAWDGSRFIVKSDTTGATSTVEYATAGSGTDISALLKLTSAYASPPVDGVAAETALAATTLLDSKTKVWYGLMFASTHIVDADHLAIAAYIEAASRAHLYGVAVTNTNVLDSAVTNDIASQLKAANYRRTLTQYSANPYAIASFFGRAFTVNFRGNNTTITLMYKQEPGVVAEDLTATQANTLISKRCNFFVKYNNNTAILQNGVMAGPYFFDEIHGTDWLRDQIQTNVYNVLYTSPTKVPQTDAGIHLLVTAVEAACAAAVNNGLLAPGKWNSGGFGQLQAGDFLPKGYYVYAPPVALQAPADRAARMSPPIQVAAKLAGAVHSVDVIVNVNR